MLKKRCESRKSLGFFRKTVNDLLKAKNHPLWIEHVSNLVVKQD